MSVLKKAGPAATSVGGNNKALKDDEWAGDYPGLWEYLTATVYPDKSARETSSLTLFVEEGRVKVCLNDRDQGRVGFISGASVMGVLDALELHLKEGTLDWRASKARPRK